MFSHVYASWEELQREKFEKIFERLGDRFSMQLKGKTILDIGAGSGYLERFLAERGVRPGKIIAIEPDRSMIKTKKNFVLSRAEEMPFKDSSFDFAFLFDVLHLVSSLDTTSLKKGCIIVATMFCNDENYREKRALLEEKMGSFTILEEFVLDSKEKEIVAVAIKT